MKVSKSMVKSQSATEEQGSESGRPLKVLQLSLWHPELVRGGAQQIAYETFKALQGTPGVEPTFLAAVDRSAGAFYKAGARITGFDGRPGEYLFLSQDYDYLWHKVANPLLVAAYADFLAELAPDVVHVHHFMLFGIDLLPESSSPFMNFCRSVPPTDRCSERPINRCARRPLRRDVTSVSRVMDLSIIFCVRSGLNDISSVSTYTPYRVNS
jgi:hypothetical protein